MDKVIAIIRVLVEYGGVAAGKVANAITWH